MISLSLKSKTWSPYVAGILIGLLQIPAFLLVETALGTSSSYVTVGDSLMSVIDPSLLSIDYAAKHIAYTAKNWWQVALVVGIVIGAFVSSRMSGSKRPPIAAVWSSFYATRAKRFLAAFLAGFIMLWGARIADGCTSGHGLSGIAQLAVSSFVTIGAMFVAGIITARLLFKNSSAGEK